TSDLNTRPRPQQFVDDLPQPQSLFSQSSSQALQTDWNVNCTMNREVLWRTCVKRPPHPGAERIIPAPFFLAGRKYSMEKSQQTAALSSHGLDDLLSRVLPAAFFLLAVGLKIQGLISFVAAPAVDRGDSSRFGFYVSVGSRISVILFLALMATLFMVREKAVKKADGLSPRIMAILGTFMMAVIAFFPRAELDIVQTLTATLIVLLGTCLSSIVLFRLGRSFSLMAEART